MTISNGRVYSGFALLDVDYDAMEKSWIKQEEITIERINRYARVEVFAHT